ncbi:MAG: AAA domain-containing protein [Dehalococcoidia bacterium]
MDEFIGLEGHRLPQAVEKPSIASALVAYFRDCAVATQRSLNLRDVFESKDAIVLDAPPDAWEQAINGTLRFEGKDAVDLAMANQIAPIEKPVALGGVFIVGRHKTGVGKVQRYCAPLLVASASIESDGVGATVSFEGDVAVNLWPLAELIGIEDEDEMFQRFEVILAGVPEAPFDDSELDRFCQILRTNLDLPLELPGFTGFTTSTLAQQVASGGNLRLVMANAVFISKEAQELSVIRELEAIQGLQLEDTALQDLLEPETTEGVADEASSDEKATELAEEIDWHKDIEVMELSDTQRQIVRRARTEDLTAVTGPPGTGKSYTICALVLDHLLAGKKVLVSSHTAKAVEVVVDMLRKVAGQFIVAVSGDRKHQRELAEEIGKLTGPTFRPKHLGPGELEQMTQRYYDLRSDLEELEEQLGEALATEGVFAFHHTAITGLAHISDKFALSPHLMQRVRLHKAKRLIKTAQATSPDASWWKRFRGRRAIEQLRRDLRATAEVDPETLYEGVRLLEHHQELSHVLEKIDSSPELMEGFLSLASLRDALLSQGKDILRARREDELARLLQHHPARLALRKFAQALRAKKPASKRALLTQVPVEVLLLAFPCWASTDRFLSHFLPLRPGLFDLGVIDEASQCDLGAAVPTLYRSKRTVIVGDPHQLRHVCFLSSAAEAASFSRHEIPHAYQATHRYSRRSLFDVAEDAVRQSANFILDEHFRSEPHIISFSNRHFYDDCLRIMTERPHSTSQQAIDVRYLSGRRDAIQARNDVEVEQAMTIVREIVETANRGGPAFSVGILSPYRDQTNALTKAVIGTFTQAEIERHDIVCGTAHSLQGDERDVVILSTVIDPNFHHASLRFLEDPNLFNVAITRAKRRLVVLSSVRPSEVPAGSLQSFLLHAETKAVPEDLPDRFHSDFERQVAEALREAGYRVISQYPSAGYYIDLAVTNGHQSLAVECDGPTHFQADGTYTTEDIQRHIVLSRAGWQIYRIPYHSWIKDPSPHLNNIHGILSQSGQAPSS